VEKYPMHIFTPIITLNMYEFFTGVDSGRSYRSKRYTEMLRLDRRDCLASFGEKLKQQFFVLRESILLENNLAVIRLECLVCR